MTMQQRTLQLRTLFLVSLLVGAHCARMSVEFNLVDGKIQRLQGRNSNKENVTSDKLKPLGRGVGNDVCRKSDLSNPQDAVDRYTEKAKSILKLAGQIEGGASFRYFALLVLREKNVWSCEKLLSLAEDEIPRELQHIMLKGNHSLSTLGQKMMTATVASMKRKGWFKDKGDCGFHPELINQSLAMETSDFKTTLRSQLLGPACTSEAAEKHLDALPVSEAKVARKTIAFFERAAAMKTVQEIERMVEHGDQHFEESADSLLELNRVTTGDAFLAVLAVMVFNVVVFGFVFLFTGVLLSKERARCDKQFEETGVTCQESHMAACKKQYQETGIPCDQSRRRSRRRNFEDSRRLSGLSRRRSLGYNW